MGRKTFVASILVLLLALYVYIYRPSRLSILVLIAILFIISLISFELIELAIKKKDKKIIAWTNNFLIVFLAAFTGILISLEVSKAKDFYNEKQNFQQKIILFQLEASRNRSFLTESKKHQIFYERNGKIYTWIPLDRAETKFCELLLADTNCTKYMDERSLIIVSEYFQLMNELNNGINETVKKIDDRKFNNEDKENYYETINLSLKDVDIISTLLDCIINENKCYVSCGEPSKNLLDTEKKYFEEKKDYEKNFQSQYQSVTPPLKEIK